MQFLTKPLVKAVFASTLLLGVTSTQAADFIINQPINITDLTGQKSVPITCKILGISNTSTVTKTLAESTVVLGLSNGTYKELLKIKLVVKDEDMLGLKPMAECTVTNFANYKLDQTKNNNSSFIVPL